jgi:ferric-dicitrate binding protein FerR (iron transport regulator)
MRSQQRRTGIFFPTAPVLLALAICSTHVVDSRALNEKAGSVTDLKGEAFAESNAARRNLEPKGAILLGDHIGTGTGSQLTMLLGRDTTIRLGERGRIVIDRFLMDAGGEITLQSGPMRFDRPEDAVPQKVEIRSSYGLIAVRGTKFFAGPEGNAWAIFVERGEVTVTGGGRRVRLRRGEGTAILRPGAQPGAVRRWTEARVSAVFGSIR